MNKDSLVLIGFMGCGKTTFGNWLAKEHGYTFVDTDQLIEEQQNRTINDIFAADGEEYFRDLETGMAESLSLRSDKIVVSVGGGLPVRPVNRAFLRQTGRVVYLKTGIDELERRLKGDTKRPLLAGGNVREKIENLMEQREDIYTDAADIIVDTSGRSFQQIYNEILRFIKALEV